MPFLLNETPTLFNIISGNTPISIPKSELNADQFKQIQALPMVPKTTEPKKYFEVPEAPVKSAGEQLVSGAQTVAGMMGKQEAQAPVATETPTTGFNVGSAAPAGTNIPVPKLNDIEMEAEAPLSSLLKIESGKSLIESVGSPPVAQPGQEGLYSPEQTQYLQKLDDAMLSGFKDRRARLEKASNELANIEDDINTKKLSPWSDKSTASRMGIALSFAVAAVGQGVAQRDPMQSFSMFINAMDKDVARQKEQLAAKKESARNLYSRIYGMVQSEQASDHMLRSLYLGQMERQASDIQYRAQREDIKQNALQWQKQFNFQKKVERRKAMEANRRYELDKLKTMAGLAEGRERIKAAKEKKKRPVGAELSKRIAAGFKAVTLTDKILNDPEKMQSFGPVGGVPGGIVNWVTGGTFDIPEVSALETELDQMASEAIYAETGAQAGEPEQKRRRGYHPHQYETESRARDKLMTNREKQIAGLESMIRSEKMRGADTAAYEEELKRLKGSVATQMPKSAKPTYTLKNPQAL